MALLGSAAMVLSFDIDPAAADEHDDWHSREHLPERLSIPGFLRGTRWAALAGRSYMVIYEVTDIDVLGSAAYLERLNNPTPWTQKMMKYYRGMRRGFCRVVASTGAGLGGAATLVRFTPAPQREATLSAWLVEQILPSLAGLAGIASAHLLRAGAAPAMTAEQQIRGRDHDFSWVLVATGYRTQTLLSLASTSLSAEQFMERGAIEAPQVTSYRLDCVLSREELATSPARPR
jgi:hypothetical protein